MNAAFVVAEILVSNPEKYAAYLPLSTASLEKYGGKFLVRSGRRFQKEGEDAHHNENWRTVIVSFPNIEIAQSWYESQAYQCAREIRVAHSEGRLFFVEGLSLNVETCV